MNIIVKTIEGEPIHIPTEASESIEVIKKRIFERDESYKPDDFKIAYGSKTLKECSSLADYGIQNETTMNMVSCEWINFLFRLFSDEEIIFLDDVSKRELP